jgi:SAM-dependent methyltransferase
MIARVSPHPHEPRGGSDTTRSESYAVRLRELEGVWWKRLLDVQAPYRWNLRRLRLGETLDVGCGIGRYLVHLSGVGVDHNARCVELARARGCSAYTPAEFRRSEHARPGRFDSLLLSHVVEHMSFAEASELIGAYLAYLRPGGRVALMAPQEAGFRSDPTHVEFMDFEKLHRLLADHALAPAGRYSFPFPRAVGRVFPHNEFIVLGRRSA